MEHKDTDIQRNVTFESDAHTLFTISSITNLQSEISNKLAKWISRQYNSNRNDLGVCNDGEESYFKLTQYLEILENIKYCSSCYEHVHPSDVIFVIRGHLNRLF